MLDPVHGRASERGRGLFEFHLAGERQDDFERLGQIIGGLGHIGDREDLTDVLVGGEVDDLLATAAIGVRNLKAEARGFLLELLELVGNHVLAAWVLTPETANNDRIGLGGVGGRPATPARASWGRLRLVDGGERGQTVVHLHEVLVHHAATIGIAAV